MTDDEIRRVEALVNAEILRNTPTRAQVMPIEQAKSSGAVMLFGEKYGDEVRVLDIGSSREFFGGPHVPPTRDHGVFQILSQSRRPARPPPTRGATRPTPPPHNDAPAP